MGMNQDVLYTLAKVAVTLAGFSGVVVGLRLRGAPGWSATELRVLWLLVCDSFLVLFFALLPVPMALADWSDDLIWSLCSALLGTWFVVGNLLALRGERRDRVARRLVKVPVITPLFQIVFVAALAMGIALWLAAFDIAVARGQAIYVLGLIVLLAFASLEFLFFIALASKAQPES
ncbi:hypothetical protein FCE95_13860 [Luteimonas gilva]|uniref:DUF2975 domain-containing protein n=1 Tax=Luteimonas gilva TaxID=2572684 RepID=A0A4U5JKR3_9GAMM|nr:hypothetical protein [Luteimonas gilva]TKR29246.1 hypothetical protein FCE95_13860 [Luteimonas gilva]